MTEPPYTRLAPLVEALVDALVPELDGPFAFFGHSLGSLIAFEVIRELRRRELPPPLHLFAAARVAPHEKFERIAVRGLDDSALVKVVQDRYQSIPEAIVAEPDLLRLVMKPLRADLEIHERYEYVPQAPLAIPITVLGGTDDRLVTRDGLEAWQQNTSGPFDVHVLPGGHFFHQEQETAVLKLLAAALRISVPAGPVE